MKKIISIVLCVIIMTGMLTGCGTQQGADENASNSAEQAKPAPRDNTAEKWTVLLYLCGSDLESNSQTGTNTIQDILNVGCSKNMQFIIQTGGAEVWHTDGISSENIGRYTVGKDGSLELIEQLPQANMGAENTLTNFLKFGVENYPAEHKALFFWDHGGGSIAGVCSDQNYSGDTLSLVEMHNAFETVDTQFDLVGYDACLMSTVETALMLKDYADYMVASQELEPSGGWDYKIPSEQLATGSIKNGSELGKIICDAYTDKYKDDEALNTLTLSVTDVHQAAKIASAMDSTAGELMAKFSEQYGLLDIVNSAIKAEQYGGGNENEGYSNMVDLASFAKNWYGKENDLGTAVESSVLYQVRGKLRSGGSGLSFYYPLKYEEEEIGRYASVSCSEPYTDYLNAAYNNLPEDTILFDDLGSISKDGEFTIAINKNSLQYVRSVQYYLLEIGEGEQEGETIVKGLGRGTNITAKSGRYTTTMQGGWPSINNNDLFVTPVEQTKEYTLFSSPILLNGNKSSLRFVRNTKDGSYKLLGVWGGVDDNGVVSKKLSPIAVGDRITPLYQQKETGGMKSELYKGDTFTAQADIKITDKPFSAKYYQLAFVATDIFGTRYFTSSAVVYNADGDGGYEISVISEDVDTEAYVS